MSKLREGYGSMHLKSFFRSYLFLEAVQSWWFQFVARMVPQRMVRRAFRRLLILTSKERG
jgi:hypothetical protein